MLKTRDLHEVSVLFNLMSHPEVYPYVRQKAKNQDEYLFLTMQTIEAEERGELISRTILDESMQPIGTINLYDINDNHGFLATWIGQPYFGKGYNQQAKEDFFEELFFASHFEAVFMKVRKTNKRSLRAIMKLPYIAIANDLYPKVYQEINAVEEVYDLFVVSKEHYTAYLQFAHDPSIDGEVVS